MLRRVIDAFNDYIFILLILSLIIVFLFKTNKNRIKAFIIFYASIFIFIDFFLIIYKYKFSILEFYLIIRSLIFNILTVLEKLDSSLIGFYYLIEKLINSLFILGLAINYSTFINRLISINLIFITISLNLKIYLNKFKEEIICFKENIYYINRNFCFSKIVLNC